MVCKHGFTEVQDTCPHCSDRIAKLEAKLADIENATKMAVARNVLAALDFDLFISLLTYSGRVAAGCLTHLAVQVTIAGMFTCKPPQHWSVQPAE